MTGEGKVVESLLLHSEYWGGLLLRYFGASKIMREAVANIVTRGRRRESFASRPTHLARRLPKITLVLHVKEADNHCTGVAIEGL